MISLTSFQIRSLVELKNGTKAFGNGSGAEFLAVGEASSAHRKRKLNARRGSDDSAKAAVVAVQLEHLVPVRFRRINRLDSYLKNHGAYC